MLLYYITDRKQFGGTDAEQRSALLRRIGDAADAGVDFIQLREKDLTVKELEGLAREALRSVHDHSTSTLLLINSRTDVALAVGADGVHLTSADIAASDARAIVAVNAQHLGIRDFIVAVSCHSVQEVRWAESHGADFVVLGPIFEKAGTSLTPVGLDAMRIATVERNPDLRVEAGDNRAEIPVLALGGVNLTNARQCMEAGAAGIAGIRLFQEGDILEQVKILRDSYSVFVARTPPSATSLEAKEYSVRYRRRLPHFQGQDRVLFITFKTNGSFDLTDPQRDIVLRCCLHDHGRRYQLFAAVVMSNHVHLLLRPLRDCDSNPFSLQEILHSLKGASAHFINSETNHRGPVWQDESFDHVIRDDVDYLGRLEYIRMNPVRARLCRDVREYKWLWLLEQH